MASSTRVLVDGITNPSAQPHAIADGKDANGGWEKTIYIVLIVDGGIVDLNCIPFPPDTPIIDQRFDWTEVESRASKNRTLRNASTHVAQ